MKSKEIRRGYELIKTEVKGEQIFNTYRLYYGIGDTPGDQGVNWWTDKDWVEHRARVEELKASGEYGKQGKCDVTMLHLPEWDTPSPAISDAPKESYKFTMIDFSK